MWHCAGTVKLAVSPVHAARLLQKDLQALDGMSDIRQGLLKSTAILKDMGLSVQLHISGPLQKPISCSESTAGLHLVVTVLQT